MKRSPRCALLVVVCFVAGILLLSLAAGTASAQIRPAMVKNVDEPGRTPYQFMINFNTFPPDCPNATTCLIGFPAVPAGKRLVVENVTMLIGVSGGQPGLFGFGDGGGLNSGNTGIISNAFTSTGITILGTTFFSIDRPVRVYFEAGATPKLKFIAAGGNVAFVGNASVHGYLIDAAN